MSTLNLFIVVIGTISVVAILTYGFCHVVTHENLIRVIKDVTSNEQAN